MEVEEAILGLHRSLQPIGGQLMRIADALESLVDVQSGKGPKYVNGEVRDLSMKSPIPYVEELE